MSRRKRKLWCSGIVICMLAVLIAGCGGNKGGTGSESPSASPSSSGSPSSTPSETAKPSDKPAEPVKLKVELWDRGNAPQGKTITDNYLTNWIKEEVKKIGIDLEFVPVPRAQEEEKLNIWLASGGAPDLILTYNATIMQRYAEQGGLYELDELLEQYGPILKEQNKTALGIAGTYKGKRYAVPARVEALGGANMKIRKDWLDKIGKEIPTSPEELYEVLKAFKEQDPGGVGKENVVPWGMAAPSQGMQSFWFGLSFAFGVNNDGPPGIIYMPTGTYKDGKFTSGWVLPEGKETFAFMNRAYKDGLIPREFATDVNNQKLNEALAKGWVGFLESNGPAAMNNDVVRQTVPDAKWVNVAPFVRPDGKQIMNTNELAGMLIMVPKTSKAPEAAIKYLNWMADPVNITRIIRGEAGIHHNLENGLYIPINPDQRKLDMFAAGDLGIIYNGSMVYTLEQMKQLYDKPGSPDAGEIYYENQEMVKQFGVAPKSVDQPRPFAEKNNAIFGKFLYEAIAKMIMASDFEKEYGNMVDGWNKLGGETYDQEVAAALQAMAQIK